MKETVFHLEVSRISPNLRIVFAAECIDEIARSIRRQGQIEPIVVSFEYDSFRILDGEKRWRACKKLGMNKIKAVVVKDF